MNDFLSTWGLQVAVVAVALAACFFWIRGVWRRNSGDVAAGGTLLLLATLCGLGIYMCAVCILTLALAPFAPGNKKEGLQMEVVAFAIIVIVVSFFCLVA